TRFSRDWSSDVCSSDLPPRDLEDEAVLQAWRRGFADETGLPVDRADGAFLVRELERESLAAALDQPCLLQDAPHGRRVEGFALGDRRASGTGTAAMWGC